MPEMIRAAPAFALAPEFDDFLFASIGEQKNGMLLSVISALARLDLDPRQEAADLAQLPKTTATCRLASLIESLPDGQSTHLDAGTIAARLIAHLPRRIGLIASSAKTPLRTGTSAMLQSQAARHLYIVLVLVILFGGLEIAATQRSAARIINSDAAASSTVVPPAAK